MIVYKYISFWIQDEAIHGFIRAKDVEFITNKIQVGNIYEISNFFITNNKLRYMIVTHVAMLQFARSTIFKNVEDDIPEIPQLKFNFVEFDQLTQKTDINYLLSGKLYFIFIFVHLYLITNKLFLYKIITNELLIIILC